MPNLVILLIVQEQTQKSIHDHVFNLCVSGETDHHSLISSDLRATGKIGIQRPMICFSAILVNLISKPLIISQEFCNIYQE